MVNMVVNYSLQKIVKITRCIFEDRQCKEKYISCATYNSLELCKRVEKNCKATNFL